MKKRATVRDVAAEAGVSPATAARALSGNASVDPVLARRVAAASQRLGYTTNVMARALRTQQTGTIGVVVPSITNPFFVSAVEALEGVLARSNRSLVLCDARNSALTEAERIEFLVSRMVDGLVVIPVSRRDSRQALNLAAAHGPVVQFDRYAPSTNTDFVGADNAEGVRQMVEHVQALGARTMAYVGAQPTSSSAAERLDAFRGLAGSPSGDRRMEFLDDFTTEWGRTAGEHLLADGPLPDAIVCGADLIAVGLLSVLQDAKVKVPADVKIVSYDDSMMGLITSPRLTSVRQPVELMAEEAIRLLGDRPDGEPRPSRKSIFSPTLVIRESTATASSRPSRTEHSDRAAPHPAAIP
jgi:LacI family transcriptional regulator